MDYMHQISRAPLLPIFAALLAASGPSWTSKPLQQWNEEDAKQILADSPWVKKVTPVELPHISEEAVRQSGRMGGGQGMDLTELSPSALTGFGSGSASSQGRSRRRARHQVLEIRWESALPVRAAELKAQEDDPPDWQGSLYAIAVYDVPGLSNSKTLMKELAKSAYLKRDGKKDLKPERVDLLPQEGGLTTIVYLFPRSEEITAADKRIEFAAVVGRLSLAEYFYTEQMQFQGKLEL
jgi:hypothetical protein